MRIVDLQFHASWAVGGALEALRSASQSSVTDVTVFRRNHSRSDDHARSHSSPVRCNDIAVRPYYSQKPPLQPLFLVSHTLRPKSFYPGGGNVISSQSSAKEANHKEVNKEAKCIVRSILFSLVSRLPTIVDRKATTEINAYRGDEVSSCIDSMVGSEVSSKLRDKAVQVRSSFNIMSDTNESKPTGSGSVENCQSCKCLDGVRALRNSHVRLLLRQLRQLRHIEKLDRTLNRLYVS